MNQVLDGHNSGSLKEGKILQVRVKAAYNNFIHEIELRGKKRKGKIVMIEKVLKILFIFSKT